MTAAQEENLVRTGILTREALEIAKTRVAGGSLVRRVAQSRAQTLVDSLTPSEVGALLHIDESRVAGDRQVYPSGESSARLPFRWWTTDR